MSEPPRVPVGRGPHEFRHVDAREDDPEDAEDDGDDADPFPRGARSQKAEDDELKTEYVVGNELALSDWARDAIALALPEKILCRPDCAGLCPECGEDLNEHPHEHERAPDARWSKLSELKLE